MHKLSHCIAGDWVPYSHEALYEMAPTRILAAAPGGDPGPFSRLVRCLTPPYLLLYVLHTPRGEAAAGRYQSPDVSRQQFEEFMQRFGRYLSADARFDFWAHAPAEQATVVWDRHDQLFAYGPLARYAAELDALGFRRGDARIVSPHQHHYRQEFDADARALLAYFCWTHSPLRAEDEQ